MKRSSWTYFYFLRFHFIYQFIKVLVVFHFHFSRCCGTGISVATFSSCNKVEIRYWIIERKELRRLKEWNYVPENSDTSWLAFGSSAEGDKSSEELNTHSFAWIKKANGLFYLEICWPIVISSNFSNGFNIFPLLSSIFSSSPQSSASASQSEGFAEWVASFWFDSAR